MKLVLGLKNEWKSTQIHQKSAVSRRLRLQTAIAPHVVRAANCHHAYARRCLATGARLLQQDLAQAEADLRDAQKDSKTMEKYGNKPRR